MPKVTEFGTLSFLSFSIIIGVLVFCRGYLLNRQVLPDRSPSCPWRDHEHHSGQTPEFRQLSLASTPWCNSKPIHSKAILVLVDALRFDFIHRMTFLSQLLEREEKERERAHDGAGDVEPSRSTTATGISACAFKFVADPPTTTMQRLKALMTGTMPTFIDASANFNSYEVEEDNLIFQLSQAKKKVAFLGDDTWLSLFPRSLFTSPFVEAHPSFNAWDLDTVDRAVNASIYRLLGTPERDDWDVLITHLLGVDHCGHRYGPSHPEMKRKLSEADSTIEHIFNSMSHDTLLVVFGDHGMTKTGDHGGDSPAETNSGLIFLSKQLKRDKTVTPAFNCYSKLKDPQSVAQIDLVPTLSTMLGLPIPFSSIGQLIPNFLANKLYSDAIGGNVAQVSRYVACYAGISNVNLSQVYDAVDEAFQNYQTMKSPETRANLHKLSEQYLQMVRSQAVSTWTQFDLASISWGICIYVLALSSLLLYTIKVPVGQSLCLLFLSSAGLIAVIINFALGPVFGLTGIKICTSLGLVVFFACLLTTSNSNSDSKRTMKPYSKRTKFHEVLSLIIYTITCITVFSNSFVINEGYVLGFVLVATALLNVMMGSKNKSEWSGLMGTKAKTARNRIGNSVLTRRKLVRDAWISLFVLALIIRTSQLFMRCREELVDCQEVFLFHKHLASLPADWVVHKFVRYGAALLSLSVFVVSFREWMTSRYCIVSSRPASVIGKYVPSVLVVLTCVFWALEGLPFAVPNLSSIRPLFSYFPSVLQSFTLIAIAFLWMKPLCCIGTRRPSVKNSRKQKSKMGGKFGETENSLKKDTTATNEETKVSNSEKGKMGRSSTNGYKNHELAESEITLANPDLKPDSSVLNNEYTKYPIPDTMSEDVFSSSLLIYCVLVTLLLVQISTAGITPAITMIPYTIVCLLGISGDVSSNGSWSLCVMWTLASQYFFYGTGHQAVFSAIPWDSAFVGGTDTLGAGAETWINWLRPGLAVLGNLHVSQIIFSLALPLVTYWKSNGMPETLLASNERSKANAIAGKWISLHALKLLACMICATLHRRHLMVWKIFAPKFIFEAISFIVTCLTTLLSLLFVTRLNYLYQCVLHSESIQLRRLLKC